MHAKYTMTATHECGFTGTLAQLELHDCAIQDNGGRCEDYPACGHTDGDGCQTLAQHTSAFWLDNPHLLGDDWDDREFDGYDREAYRD